MALEINEYQKKAHETADYLGMDQGDYRYPVMGLAEEAGEVSGKFAKAMIRNCGGQNLQEVLATYVPGMNIIDCNDDINIAMRGIYSNGQEKILKIGRAHV